MVEPVKRKRLLISVMSITVTDDLKWSQITEVKRL